MTEAPTPPPHHPSAPDWTPTQLLSARPDLPPHTGKLTEVDCEPIHIDQLREHTDVHMAQEIHEDSWLNDDRYTEFRNAYHYAAGKTHAIPALAKLTPEQTYWLWTILNRGAEYHRTQQEQQGTP